MISNLVYVLCYIGELIVFISPIVIASMLINKIIDNHIEKKEAKIEALDTKTRLDKIKYNEMFKMIEKEYK